MYWDCSGRRIRRAKLELASGRAAGRWQACGIAKPTAVGNAVVGGVTGGVLSTSHSPGRRRTHHTPSRDPPSEVGEGGVAATPCAAAGAAYRANEAARSPAARSQRSDGCAANGQHATAQGLGSAVVNQDVAQGALAKRFVCIKGECASCASADCIEGTRASFMAIARAPHQHRC